ncbi:MAG: hypothetical protein H0V10_17310 [Geodermatophilaceae bacterium]|nr:hypothetical protein [Geodermatophilaceae bacterium]
MNTFGLDIEIAYRRERLTGARRSDPERQRSSSGLARAARGEMRRQPRS